MTHHKTIEWFAAVQYLPRPIYHGIGHSPFEAFADARANDADAGGLEIVPITTRLAETIMRDGGDIRDALLDYGERGAPHDLADNDPSR